MDRILKIGKRDSFYMIQCDSLERAILDLYINYNEKRGLLMLEMSDMENKYLISTNATRGGVDFKNFDSFSYNLSNTIIEDIKDINSSLDFDYLFSKGYFYKNFPVIGNEYYSFPNLLINNKESSKKDFKFIFVPNNNVLSNLFYEKRDYIESKKLFSKL